MKPLISILIPAYNAERFLPETLESALAQTWPEKEIIVVNDGSTDGTRKLLEKYESRGVKVADQKNQGAAATRNNAFSLSRGEFVQWLDADDLLHPQKIEKQMTALGSNGARTLLSGPWADFNSRYHRAHFVPTPLWEDLTPAEWLIRKMGLNLHMQTATWLVSRKISEEAGPWNIQLLGDDDGEYFCRILLASERIKFVPEAKVYYRRSGNTRLSYIGRSNKKLDAQFTSMEKHIKYLLSLEDSPRSRSACVQYLQNWLPNFYPERKDVFARCEQIAQSFGGLVQVPKLSWKYDWIRALFGWDAAKQVQLVSRELRGTITRGIDSLLAKIDRPRLSTVMERDPVRAH